MRIALDAMGGDDAPEFNVHGALAAVERDPEIEVVLVGDPARVEPLLDQSGHASDRVSVAPSEGVIGMDEKPTEGLRKKPNNSITVCWQLMAGQEVDAVVSAGNTGAVVGAGLRTRLFLKGVRRPGIAVPLPTARGRSVLVDVGANPAARPEHLFQYAVMGAIYASEMLGVENPRIGLMNIGSEDLKGNDLYRQTHQFLSQSGLQNRYVGNVEGRGLYLGEADVLVCEGFVGNVVLKVSEGMATFMLQAMTQGLVSKFAEQGEAVQQALVELGREYDYREGGGAPLLGIDGVCIICHGSSDARSIANALCLTRTFQDRRINPQIVEELARSAR